jgi:hypothetical protein
VRGGRRGQNAGNAYGQKGMWEHRPNPSIRTLISKSALFGALLLDLVARALSFSCVSRFGACVSNLLRGLAFQLVVVFSPGYRALGVREACHTAPGSLSLTPWPAVAYCVSPCVCGMLRFALGFRLRLTTIPSNNCVSTCVSASVFRTCVSVAFVCVSRGLLLSSDSFHYIHRSTSHGPRFTKTARAL